MHAAGSASLAQAKANPAAARVLCTTECIICVRDFAVGDRVRWLQCPHAFHTECIDEWVLRHKNRCPLCQQHIGPPEPSLEELLGHPLEGAADGVGGAPHPPNPADHLHID